MARHAVVLGGSGHIGNAVIRELLLRGYRVTAASRRPRTAANLFGLPVRIAPGDSEDPGQIDAWLRDHDLVVDAAVPYPVFPATSPGDNGIDRAVARARELLTAVERHRCRLALVSSFVTARPADGLGERALRRLHPYFTIKEAVEAEVLEAAESGFPVVVVRPTLCLGPWDLKPREMCFIPQLLAGEIPAVLDHLVNVVDVREVARGLVGALVEERWGESIGIAGHNVTLGFLYRWVCDLGGAKPPPWRAPAALFVPLALVTETMLSWLDRRDGGVAGEFRGMSLVLTLLTLHRWQAPSSAQQELGAVPRALSATLADSIDWYRKIGYC